MRLDFVSPLPPVRSGIADYSADLLAALGSRAEIRLVRLPGQEIARDLAQRYEVVAPEQTGRGGRLPVYQMGNNEHHVGVYELALERPGLLTLHDVVLHHFLLDRTYNQGSFDEYQRLLTEEHGWVGEAAARPLAWPGGYGSAAQFALPAHGNLLRRQRLVLVHSRWAAELLAEELRGLAVRAVTMGVPLPPPADDEVGRAFRQRHAIPAAAPVLGAFGFQTPIKRTDVAIRALAQPPLQAAHLVLAGAPAPSFDLQQEARAAGVEDRVHLLGYLPFAELEAAIAACDLCLNLRYPSAGETSASLLRILAVGRPALVSDYAQFAELPDGPTLKVALGQGEEVALAKAAGELLAATDRLREMGAAARRYVAKEHDPQMAADQLLQACEDALSLPAPDPEALAKSHLPAPTSLAWEEMLGELEVEGAELPWPAGERRRLRARLTNRSRARWLAGERPEGGVALETQLWVGEENLNAHRGWVGLPVDLEPGSSHEFVLDLRRPLADSVRLRLLPHVLTYTGFHDLRGPVWEREL